MGLLQSFNALFFDAADDEAAAKAKQDVLDHSKVLVIDDDKDFAAMTAQTLTEAGFQVLKCNNGPKGLNMMRYAGGDVKVVILDYDMPQLDGLATLKYIRQIAGSVKVIAITGVDVKFLPADFREGVDLLLFKPFQSAELVNQIRSYVLPAAKETPA